MMVIVGIIVIIGIVVVIGILVIFLLGEKALVAFGDQLSGLCSVLGFRVFSV